MEKLLSFDNVLKYSTPPTLWTHLGKFGISSSTDVQSFYTFLFASGWMVCTIFPCCIVDQILCWNNFLLLTNIASCFMSIIITIWVLSLKNECTTSSFILKELNGFHFKMWGIYLFIFMGHCDVIPLITLKSQAYNK